MTISREGKRLFRACRRIGLSSYKKHIDARYRWIARKREIFGESLWSAAKVSKDSENISVNQERRPVSRLVELTRHYHGRDGKRQATQSSPSLRAWLIFLLFLFPLRFLSFPLHFLRLSFLHSGLSRFLFPRPILPRLRLSLSLSFQYRARSPLFFSWELFARS